MEEYACLLDRNLKASAEMWFRNILHEIESELKEKDKDGHEKYHDKDAARKRKFIEKFPIAAKKLRKQSEEQANDDKDN